MERGPSLWSEARLDLCFRGPEVPLFHPEREQRGFGATRQTRELTIEINVTFMADAPSSLVFRVEERRFSAAKRGAKGNFPHAVGRRAARRSG